MKIVYVQKRVNVKIVNVKNKINRTSSTVPFGYKLSEDQKVYEPVEKELELLDKAFDYVRTCGAAKAARWLTVASGRRISNPGLTKRMNKGLHL